MSAAISREQILQQAKDQMIMTIVADPQYFAGCMDDQTINDLVENVVSGKGNLEQIAKQLVSEMIEGFAETYHADQNPDYYVKDVAGL